MVNNMDGVIVVDKPQGWTSHDVVGKMRRLAGTKRVGHLGTLDPLATGVLPLVLNQATRLSQFFVRVEKVYLATVILGQATDSYDAEGEPTGPFQTTNFTAEEIEKALSKFRGTMDQMPPQVSAKKINGVPAYKLARRNEPVELKAVTVTIARLELVALVENRLEILLECSGGTYIRSIAHDLGAALGCGAHIGTLRRTRSGSFEISQARTLEELAKLSEDGRLSEALIPNADLLPDYPLEQVDDSVAQQIRHGRDFHTSPFNVPQGSKYVKAVGTDGTLIAIGEAKLPNLYHPIVVL